MSILFVSHSSKEDVAATSLEAWLHARGFNDIFVDHSSIAGGDKWAEQLRASAGSCRVVICLVTEHWLASDECFAEFRAAWYMGKRIIPLIALSSGSGPRARLASVLNEHQGFNVAACMNADGSLDLGRDPHVEQQLELGLRAAGALAKVGLDPEAFAIDRKARPTPFPGLASFGDHDADAALFYGRSREIADTLEDLRKMRAGRDQRVYVIIGASGAGKSSLLKAGIISRLRRELPAWLPLRAFRPGADPLLNFAEALARTFADYGKSEAKGLIRDHLKDAWSKAERGADGELTTAGVATLERVLEGEGTALRAAANCPGASILISIDQAEEIARAEGDGGDAFGDYLRVALRASGSSWLLAFTVRTDSFAELQTHRRCRNLQARGYDLRAVPTFRFTNVVEEPARRYGVEIDHLLVDALMEDAPDEDALPLLAFVLERLWRQYGLSGALTKDHYDRLGGLKGLIEVSAERALRGIAPEQDVALPAGALAPAQDVLGAATFVPALVQLNERGATIRRVAEWDSFRGEQQQLLALFDGWRLIVRKGAGAEKSGGTVEVAHEALFREWSRLSRWLEPERARLERLRVLEMDAGVWERNGRDPNFLNHRDERLAEANALAASARYRDRLSPRELHYICACGAAERRARKRTRRLRTAFGILVLGVVLAWLSEGWLAEQWRLWRVIEPYMTQEVTPYVLTRDAERALKPNDAFKECAKDCPEMVVIPGGKFVMGSPADEERSDDLERPQHEVTIEKSFAVSRFELTFDEWDACVRHGGNCDPGISDRGHGRGRIPAMNITWNDTQDYVTWLSLMTGRRYRLLTDAEWEYAVRAGTTTAFHFGSAKSALPEYAWYNANSSDRPHPVGQKKANAFGLHDMYGNVWEWVEDCYHDSYIGAPTNGTAWEEADCKKRVLRGGSWDGNPRSALRQWDYSVFRGLNVGFRVARTLGQ